MCIWSVLDWRLALNTIEDDLCRSVIAPCEWLHWTKAIVILAHSLSSPTIIIITQILGKAIIIACLCMRSRAIVRQIGIDFDALFCKLLQDMKRTECDSMSSLRYIPVRYSSLYFFLLFGKFFVLPANFSWRKHYSAILHEYLTCIRVSAVAH